MENNVIYTESQSGLTAFYAKIYSLVGMGIGLSALVSFLMLYVFTDNFMMLLYQYQWVYTAAFFVELALVFFASGAARKNSPMALPLFLGYSALNGFTLSFIIARYTQTTVLQAFVTSAILFFVMALIGKVTKKDLSGLGKAMMAAVLGLVIAGLINLFIGSGMMSFVISCASVVIFSGLIAYENQLIKTVYDQIGGRVSDGWAISMALNLYLDFINLFINLLRLFGSRD